MKSSAFNVAKKYFDSRDVQPVTGVSKSPSDVFDGTVTAVLIDSDLGPLWFTFDDAWKSGDDLPIFYASELPYLREMSKDELRRRYEEKRGLRGGWIRARTDGSKLQ